MNKFTLLFYGPAQSSLLTLQKARLESKTVQRLFSLEHCFLGGMEIVTSLLARWQDLRRGKEEQRSTTAQTHFFEGLKSIIWASE